MAKTRRERQSARMKRRREMKYAEEKPETVAKAKGGFYERHYKALLIIPFIVLVLAFAQLGFQYATTGDFLNKGVSLKGGLTITIPTDINAGELQSFLRDRFPDNDVLVRSVSEFGTQTAVMISATGDVADEASMEEIERGILQAAQERVPSEEYSVEVIGPSLGQSFFVQTLKAILIAFLLMGMVIFFYFGENRNAKIASAALSFIGSLIIFQTSGFGFGILATLIIVGLIILYVLYSPPSAAVILAALSDIVVTLAIVNMMGVQLSTAGIAAFLMLIGYSVDTDILLSVRVLKRSGGTIYDRVISAMGTGITMAVTSIVAATVGLFVSQSETIRQIMLIILIGLIVDVMNTWLQNAGIIRWWAERRT